MGRLNSSTELFDITNKLIISNKTNDLLCFINYNLKANLLKIDTNSYILSGLEYYEENNKILYYNQYIVKFNIYLISDSLNISIKVDKKFSNTPLEFGSCFLTEESEIIICFYGYKEQYLISAYTKDLTNLTEEFYTLNKNEVLNYYYYFYFYAIYFFKEDAGVFINYIYKKGDHYPAILFKKYLKKK